MALASKVLSTTTTSTISARLPNELITSIQKVANASNQSPTEFVKISIENEINRRLLCQPEQAVTLSSLKTQISHINEHLASCEVNERRIFAILEVIAVAMGVNQ